MGIYPKQKNTFHWQVRSQVAQFLFQWQIVESVIDTYNDIKKDLETYQSLKKLRTSLMTQQKQMYPLSFLTKQYLNCCIILEILKHLLSKDTILGLIISILLLNNIKFFLQCKVSFCNNVYL